MFSVSCAYVIKGSRMRRVGTITDFIVIDGVPFFKLAKSNQQLAAILYPQTIGCTDGRVRRPLAHTNIIEQIIELRDIEYKKMQQEEHMKVAKVDFNIDKQSKRHKPNPVEVNGVIRLRSPDVCGVQGVEFSCKLDPPSAGCYAELSAEFLTYLADVVAKQVEGGDIHHQHPRRAAADLAVDTGVKGLTFSYAKNQEKCLCIHTSNARSFLIGRLVRSIHML